MMLLKKIKQVHKTNKKGINSLWVISLFVILVFNQQTFAQEIPVSFRNEGIYDFLDELANGGHISISSVVKPFTNSFILKCLNESSEKRELLTKRQRKELDFYLIQYRFLEKNGKNLYADSKKGNLITRQPNLNLGFLPLGLHYKDSLFTFSLKPIWGGRGYVQESGQVIHSWGGAEAWGNIGNVSIYASLRDNYQTEILAKPSYFTLDEGGNYKENVQGRKGGDYSEMRGGVVYGWKWGSVGLVKDQVEWGSNYHGATIFSGRAPSFAMIKLNLKPTKWFELNYFHGWLVSEVVDSSRSYFTPNGDYRTVFRDKYIAANIFTFTPFKRISFSVGNSIIYSDIKVQPAYLIPVMFYKSIDHTLNHDVENQNSQMFFDLSFRRIKNLHLYSTIYVDEFSVTRVFNPKKHNFVSQKYGIRLSNWPIRNTSMSFEYTKANPLTYKHRIPATTFETNKYNLGHYLRDNSEELWGAIDVKPFRGFLIRADIVYARHGNEYTYVTSLTNDELPFMKDVTWQNLTYSLTCRLEFIHDSWLYLNVSQSDIQGFDVDGHIAQYYLDLYTTKFFQGKKQTITFGLNFGF